MKMSGFILVLLLGLTACAYLVRRHDRPVPALPAAPTPRAPRQEDLRPVDAWQRSLAIAPSTACPAGTQRLREQLRREDEKQRPQEGRN